MTQSEMKKTTAAAYFYLVFTVFLIFKEKCIDVLEERKILPVSVNLALIKSVQSNGTKDTDMGKCNHI